MRLIDADALWMDVIHRMDYCDDILEMIEAMPTVEQERKTGKWIKIPEFRGDDVSGFVDNYFICSECKKEAEINPCGFYVLSDYCPNCGSFNGGGSDDQTD